jgi:hypothetical protein
VRSRYAVHLVNTYSRSGATMDYRTMTVLIVITILSIALGFYQELTWVTCSCAVL